MIKLRDILGKNLVDIITTGYSEKHSDFYTYSPMLWWLYLKFENTYIRLTWDGGIITASKVEEIVCNFDIEDDIFTISSISNRDFGIINQIDVFYDAYDNLIALGIEIPRDNTYHFVDSLYIFIDALDFNGFIVEMTKKRDLILESYKFTTLDTIC
ncbi:MAG TPA: hypothetical protein VF677_10780 [Flavobacterium sp.]|jgi:hypothetical protein